MTESIKKVSVSFLLTFFGDDLQLIIEDDSGRKALAYSIEEAFKNITAARLNEEECERCLKVC